MKVITLKQPWASLVAQGIKKYEFRSWKTNYRGKVLIHAGKGVDQSAMKKVKHLKLDFPTSKIIATVEISDCILLTDQLNKKISNENKLIYGSKDRTGYVWLLKNPEEITINEHINGKLGFWNYEIN